MRQPNYSELLSEIVSVLKLLLVLTATNAEPERGFSTLKRVKTYPRNRMTQERLNNVILEYTKRRNKQIEFGSSCKWVFCSKR